MSMKVKELVAALKRMPPDADVWFSDSAELFPSCAVSAVRNDFNDDRTYKTITLLGPERLRAQPFEKHVYQPKKRRKVKP